MSSIKKIRVPSKVKDRLVARLNEAGCKLREQQRYEMALILFQRAVAVDKTFHPGWMNIGCTLLDMQKPDEAEEHMVRALALAPEIDYYHRNIAVLYGAQRRYEAAEAEFEKTIEKTRNKKMIWGAQWDRSLLRLERGDWERGLEDYEVRMPLLGPPRYMEMPCPLWKGEPLDDKTLYIAPEMGIGDRILFSRFMVTVKERWPTCHIMTCVGDTFANLSWEYRKVATLLPSGIPWPEGIDYGVNMASLPFCLGIRPDNVPPDPGFIYDRVKKQFEKKAFNCPVPDLPALKVGIIWTGNPGQSKNVEREIPLKLLLPLAADPRVMLYSLQVGDTKRELAQTGGETLVIDVGSSLGELGLVYTGEVMMNMDLIITVCTGPAHLAGVLGVPTWTLLCRDPYWVWMQDKEYRRDTVWYPNMRLFRQPSSGSWTEVIDEVQAELTKMVNDKFGPKALKEIANG